MLLKICTYVQERIKDRVTTQMMDPTRHTVDKTKHTQLHIENRKSVGNSQVVTRTSIINVLLCHKN